MDGDDLFRRLALPGLAALLCALLALGRPRAYILTQQRPRPRILTKWTMDSVIGVHSYVAGFFALFASASAVDPALEMIDPSAATRVDGGVDARDSHLREDGDPVLQDGDAELLAMGVSVKDIPAYRTMQAGVDLFVSVAMIMLRGCVPACTSIAMIQHTTGAGVAPGLDQAVTQCRSASLGRIVLF